MSEQLTLEPEEATASKPQRDKKPHNENTQEWRDCCDVYQKSVIKYSQESGIDSSRVSRCVNKDKSVSFKIEGKLIAKLLPNPVISIAFPVEALNKYAPDIAFSPIKSPEGYGKISVDSCIAPSILKKSIFDYVPSHTFGCCHRYKECSRAEKCLHPDLFYAKGCYYRKNLEAGRIFYK